MEKTKELSKIYPGTYYDAGPWAALKLMVLLMHNEVYTKIIPNYFQRMFYVDLLAGSGIDQIRSTNDLIVGSPIIPCIFSQNPFDTLIFIEKNETSATALEARLKRLLDPERFIVYKTDCNSSIAEIESSYLSKPSSHHLAFVDSEGMEVSWETMNRLLQCQGDLLFNFQTRLINRVRGKAKDSKKDAECLNEFYGSDIWKTASCAEDLLACYKDNICSHRAIVEHITVKGTHYGNFYYDIIFATRKTKGGSPWMRAFWYIKQRIEKESGDAVKKALDVMVGRIRDLSYFFPSESQKRTDRDLTEFL